MKVVSFVVASLLLTGVASADPYYGPPGGYPPPQQPPAGVLVPVAPMPMPMPAEAPPPGPRQNAPLRAAILERFDRDHDGQLNRAERRHAIRALRRMTRRMARQEARAERRGRRNAPRGDAE
jgi:hypothetical protein